MNSRCCTPNYENSSIVARSFREATAWLVPTALVALVPKCPMCLVAYVSLYAGIGLSIAAATYLRWTMLLFAAAAFLFLLFRRVGWIRATFKKSRERKPSHV